MTISGGTDRWTNSAQSTLSSGMNATQTTLPITSFLPFPSGSKSFFRVLIDTEIIQITGGQGTSTFTVIRGVEGTAATTHSGGATVTHDISAFELNSFRQEFNVLAYGAVGDNIANDYNAFQNATDDAHAQTIGGVVFLPPFSYNLASVLTTYSNVVYATYGATLSGAGAASVAPLVRWSLLGGLTVPGVLSATGGAVVSGGATISGGMTLNGGGTLNGNLILTATQTNGQTGLTLAPSSVSGVTGETVMAKDSPQTLTITAAYTNQRFRLLRASTITAATPLTVATAATLAIEGPPIAASSATITTPVSLWVQSGTSKFDGVIDINTLTGEGTSLANGGTAYSFTTPHISGISTETIVTNFSSAPFSLTGTYARQRFHLFSRPTVNGPITLPIAATVAIADAPQGNGSASITNSYSLWVQAGISQFDGPVSLGGQALTKTRNSADSVPIMGGTNPSGVTIYVQINQPSSANEGDIWISA